MSKQRKIIIGLTGDPAIGKTEVAKLLSAKGFRHMSVNAFVKSFSGVILPESFFELNKDNPEIWSHIRKMGNSISPQFWINLLMNSIVEKGKQDKSYSKIVIDDIQLDEIGSLTPAIMLATVRRDQYSHNRLAGINFIDNNGTLDDLKIEVDNFYKKILKRSLSE